MSLSDHFLAFNFNDAEENIYKMLIQLSKIPKSDSKAIYNKIKVTDLIEISKYSKPKVYEIMKRLAEKELIQIDNTRPMFIKPIDPETSFKNLCERKKKELDEAANTLINEINSLPPSELRFPFSEAPQFSFIDGTENYYKMLKNMLQKTKKEIILIIGFLVSIEEDLLRDFITEHSTDKLKLLVLYGGAPKFTTYFKSKILSLKSSKISKQEGFIQALFAPPIRITIVDDIELLMALKPYQEGEIGVSINKVSAIHSANRNIIDYARDTFYMLKPTADAKLIEGLLRMRTEQKGK